MLWDLDLRHLGPRFVSRKLGGKSGLGAWLARGDRGKGIKVRPQGLLGGQVLLRVQTRSKFVRGKTRTDGGKTGVPEEGGN